MSARASDGPPLCQLCHTTKCTALRNPQLRAAWSWDEGLKWAWKRNVAYWKLCLSCHRYQWPKDHRVGNRYSRPSWDRWHKYCVRGKGRLSVGDYYLTQSVPEFIRPAEPSLPRMHTHLGLRQAFMQAFVPQPVPASMAAQEMRRDMLLYCLGQRQSEDEEPSGPRLFTRIGRRRAANIRLMGTYEDIIPIPWLEPAMREEVFLVDITFIKENKVEQAYATYTPQRMRFQSQQEPLSCDTTGCVNVLPPDPRAAMWSVTLCGGGGYHTAFLCRACVLSDSFLDLREVFDDTARTVGLRRQPADATLALCSQPYWPDIAEALRGHKKRKR